MNTIYVKIDGIHCDNCRNKIKKELLNIKYVTNVEIVKNIASITSSRKISVTKLIDTINSLDYFTKKEYISENIKDIDSGIKLKEFIIIVISLLLLIFLIKKIFGYNIFNVIPTIDSSITYGMLFVTGILTSIHCISMCGAINLVATIGSESKVNLKRPLLYNLGRLISYTLLGGIVGLIGSVISINETINGLIIIFVSVVMLLMSLNMLNLIKVKFPKLIRLKSKVKTNNSFLIGLLNGFMPCGPLQAMQVYALSTGSFIRGALSMFLFCLGTIPLMLGVGVILNIVKGRKKIILNNIASILILLLSIGMLFRGLSTIGINFKTLSNPYKNYTASTIYNDYQEVRINLSYGSYDDIVVQKGKKVKLIINAPKKYLTGCNNAIIINEFNIKKTLEVGENIIEFTPNKTGTYSMSCWMNMITNNIKVIDDEKYFEVKK